MAAPAARRRSRPRRRTGRCCARPRRRRSRSGSGRSAENPSRDASSRAAWRAATMSASPRIGMRTSSSRRCPRSISGWLSSGAQLALEQVPAGVDLPLAPPVAAGERQQHRPAPVGRRLGVLERQQVLDPQPGPGPVELGGDGTGGEPELRGQRPGVLPGHLVGEQGLPLPLGQPGQRLRRRPPAPPSPAAPRPAPRRAAGRRRGAGCGGAGPPPATSKPPRCGRTIAYGSSIPGSTRAAAASTRTSVSWTRSSATTGSRTRAPTIRRTIGISAATSSSVTGSAGVPAA